MLRFWMKKEGSSLVDRLDLEQNFSEHFILNWFQENGVAFKFDDYESLVKTLNKYPTGSSLVGDVLIQDEEEMQVIGFIFEE